MFLPIKPYLHLNCVLMLNWIAWNGNVSDIKTALNETELLYVQNYSDI